MFLAEALVKVFD